MKRKLARLTAVILLLMAANQPAAGIADSPIPPPLPPSYADLADLSDQAPLVIRAKVRKVALVEPARAPGLRPGWARLYIEAKTEALIAGSTPVGEALRYLVDVPLDPKGKVPKLKKRVVILFARPVPSRPGEIQLTAPDAQLLWDPALEQRVKGVLGELYSAGAPQRISGVREAIHVPGDLAGAGETQIFLTAANGEPAAITVRRAPGQAPRWGVSFSELVASDGAPARDTLGWYRLACFLPAGLPQPANISDAPADRVAAARDYAFVMVQLGPCPRIRR
ncbi:MAG: hypothetical protein ABL914_08265 [Novosphingobium sp.]